MSDEPDTVPEAAVPEDAGEGRPSLIGTTIAGRYLIEEMIGSGGMGTVYKGQHVHMKKTLALKVLHRELAAVNEIVARFEREAIAAGRIDHPNVARATDFGRLEDGSFYLVMEFVSGRSLSSLIAEGPLPTERALYIARQIAAAIDAAHEAGIVHRDLKPENVMLVERDDDPYAVKVLDFGIAKVELAEPGPPSQITRVGSVFGTPEYMAPEQAAGSAVDHRVDLYALGVISYELLAGHPPFSGDVMSVLTSQLTDEPPPLPDSVPEDVRALVAALLQKQPDQRISTAREAIEKISRILDDRDAVARATTAPIVELPAEAPTRRFDRRLLIAAAATAIVAALVIVVVVTTAAGEPKVPPPLLDRGGFAVELPTLASATAARRRAGAPNPSATSNASAPTAAPSTGAAPSASTPASESTRQPGHGTGKKSHQKAAPKEKKKTGPGGIYIPPPSEWF